MSQNLKYDIVVVGGGHAGTEAALVSARMGCKTALLSIDKNKIGQMSCNPAIGGLGKGQLVKEIDALFGEMGVAIDETGIQFRTLNSSKGPAVRSSRAQADRDDYRKRITKAVLGCENLDVIEALAGSLVLEGQKIVGIKTEDGTLISANAVILTTGTFLSALMHTGESQTKGGRIGEKASYSLGDSIRDLGLRMGRMKTGTPPRLSLKSMDLSKLVEQPGDTPIKPFSYRTDKIDRPQISCWITATNEKAHQAIFDNVHRSPMFNGQIGSTGPRYCPSIEDKVYRFKDKLSHNIFLEPEGFTSDIVYPNGISTSLPKDVQETFVRSIKGLENVEFYQYGYAVEYDHVDPTELDSTLKPKNFEGLYCAGQINGTSGYEEAGAQGIIAGINAALFVQGKEPFTLRRDEAYLGVMTDDLTTLGVIEPYRMFTSRAEYRLHLREDNADSRLTPYAREFGLVNDSEWARFEKRMERLEKEKTRLHSARLLPSVETNQKLKELNSAEIFEAQSFAVLLKRPELTYEKILKEFPTENLKAEDYEVLTQRETERIETEIKFEGYLKRQEEDILRLKKMEEVQIPADFAYSEIKGLSIEVRERLSHVRPQTLGQAGRVSGVTPSAVSILGIHLRKRQSASVATSTSSSKTFVI